MYVLTNEVKTCLVAFSLVVSEGIAKEKIVVWVVVGRKVFALVTRVSKVGIGMEAAIVATATMVVGIFEEV